jgi:DNA invertase Pin-like site-specific DNA recombinase
MNKSVKAIGYTRQASVEQIPTPYSVSSQILEIQKYAFISGIQITKWFEEVADKKHEYKELKNALIYCKKHPEITLLVVSSANRIARRFESYIYWKAAFAHIDVELKAVDVAIRKTDSKMGQFIELMLNSVGELDHGNHTEMFNAGILPKKRGSSK